MANSSLLVGSLANCSLYVGDLSPGVTEAKLFEIMCSAGPILSIRVCRDMITRRSLGYAYVNFQSHEHAKHALETMNFKEVDNKPMRIMWSSRDPSLRRTNIGNIIIKNLDPTITSKALNEICTKFGGILSCKVATDESGLSKGYGYVQFETDAAADEAIRNLNGFTVCNKQLFAERFRPRKDRQIANANTNDSNFTNVFLKNLGELNEQQLKSLCERFGRITSCQLQRDCMGNSKGFGFVNFESHDAAVRCVEGICYKIAVNCHVVYAGRAQPKAERLQELKANFESFNSKGVNLYVKNLDDEIDDYKLKEVFSPFGHITSAKVMTIGGIHRGHGFVCFSSEEEAKTASAMMHGRIIVRKPLFVVPAQRKEQRKAAIAEKQVGILMAHYTSLDTSHMNRIQNVAPPVHQTPSVPVPINPQNPIVQEMPIPGAPNTQGNQLPDNNIKDYSDCVMNSTQNAATTRAIERGFTPPSPVKQPAIQPAAPTSTSTLHLWIKPKSLPEGIKSEDVSFEECYDASQPPMDRNQVMMCTMVQSQIKSGYTGIYFKQPVQWTIPHKSKNLSSDDIQVWYSEKGFHWTKIVDGGKVDFKEGSTVNVLESHLEFSTRRVGIFAFLQRHFDLERRVLIFMTSLDSSAVFLRLHLTTQEKIDDVIAEEERQDAYQCARSIRYQLSAEPTDVEIAITDVQPTQWTPPESKEEITHSDLYKEEDAYCEFRLSKENFQAIGNGISGRVRLHQDQQNQRKKVKKFYFDSKMRQQFASSNSKETKQNQPGKARNTTLPNKSEEDDDLSGGAMQQIEEVVPDRVTGLYKHRHIKYGPPTQEQLHSPIQFYNMLSTRKGLAYILNNSEFTRRRTHSKRLGSEVDFANMKHLCKELGYEMECHENLSAKKIEQTTKKFAARFGATEVIYQSCLVVLMSHGNCHGIFGVDEKLVELKKLHELFDINKCPKLKGKPKLFVVQACRTEPPQQQQHQQQQPQDQQQPIQNADTVYLQPQGASSEGQPVVDIVNVTNDAPPDLQTSIRKVAENADMHLAFACTEGSYSLRNEITGSWFVQAIIEVFLARAHKDHLEELMAMVRSRVTNLNGRMYNPETRQIEVVTQTPASVTSLTRKMYFFPKFPLDS